MKLCQSCRAREAVKLVPTKKQRGMSGLESSGIIENFERFAELIVRECVQVVNAADDSCEDYYGTIIKEHFGVK